MVRLMRYDSVSVIQSSGFYNSIQEFIDAETTEPIVERTSRTHMSRLHIELYIESKREDCNEQEKS